MDSSALMLTDSSGTHSEWTMSVVPSGSQTSFQDSQHPNSCCIFPITNEEHVLLVQQVLSMHVSLCVRELVV